MEKKLDGNYTRILQVILNKSLWQHPTKQLVCGHLPPITKTIKIRRTWHTVHCWRSMDELISEYKNSLCFSIFVNFCGFTHTLSLSLSLTHTHTHTRPYTHKWLTPSHGRVKAGRPTRTYVQQLCADTGCSLVEAMDDRGSGERERERERVRDIHADSATWWWWWYLL